MSPFDPRAWVLRLRLFATASRACDRVLSGLLIVSWLAVLAIGVDRILQWGTGQRPLVPAASFLLLWSAAVGAVILATAAWTWATRPSPETCALAADQRLEMGAALITAWESRGAASSTMTPLIHARVEKMLSIRTPESVVPPIPAGRRLAGLAAAGVIALLAFRGQPWAAGAEVSPTLRLVGPAKDVTLRMGQDVEIAWSGSSGAALPGGVELTAESESAAGVPQKAGAPAAARIARNLPVSGGLIWNTYGMRPGVYRIRGRANPVGFAPLDRLAPGRIRIVSGASGGAEEDAPDEQSPGPHSGAGQGRPEPTPFPWQAPSPVPTPGPGASGGNSGGNSKNPGEEEGGPLLGDEERRPGTFSDRDVTPLLGEGPTRKELVELFQGLSESQGGGATARTPQDAPELLQEYTRRAEKALGRESYDAADRGLLKRYFDALLPDRPTPR